MEKFCKSAGFTQKMIDVLLAKREPIVCSGKLYSVQHRRSFEIKDAVCKIEDDSYIKDAIAPIFQSDDTNIIETFSNLDNAQNMKASLFLQWYPLWTLSLYKS